MKTLAALALIAASLCTAPAFAGDTPVIYVVTGIPTTVKGGYPEVFYDRGGPLAGSADPRTFRGPTASAGAQPQSVTGHSVGTVALARGDTDVLYARLLDEARRRGLR